MSGNDHDMHYIVLSLKILYLVSDPDILEFSFDN